ncbi:MAG: hypothetical protein J6D17_05220, partial [Bacteroides sp.]|nr:hypothetical protein [Bacteroides sp.]
MRKMYLLLSLALLLCSVNDAWGRLKKKDPQPTELGIDSPRDGMMLAFNRIAWNAQGNEADLWLCASGGNTSILTSFGESNPDKNTIGWILEASDVVIKQGVQSFYLKNFQTGEYLSFDESDFNDSDISDMFLGGKNIAKSFIIVPTKQGVPLMGYEETDFGDKGGVLKDGDWMILSKFSGEYRGVNTCGGVGAKAVMAIYPDYAAWYTTYEVEYFESPLADLQDALDDMPELQIKGGSNPGEYPQALVDEYNAARNAASDLIQKALELTKVESDAAIDRLRKAYAAIEAAGHNPLVNGFFRIVNAAPGFELVQGRRYAMTVVDDVPAWRALGSTEANEIWHITTLGDNKVTMQNVGNAQYVAGHDVMSKKPTGELAITFIDNASSAYINYNDGGDFHAKNHGRGAGMGGNLVPWSHINTDGGIYSTWFIEAVSDDELAQIEDILQQSKITAEFNELLAMATEKYNMAAVYNKTGDGLITTVDQLSTNADHNAITGYPDGQGLAGLIDGDVHTFFHSLWRSVAGAPDAYHNLTVDLKAPLSKFAFSMTPRKYTPGYSYETEPNDFYEYVELLNRPTEIILYGAEAGADIAQPKSWKKLQLITGLPSSRDISVSDDELTFTTPGYPLFGDYQYLRFEVIRTNNNASITVNGHAYPYFSMAEFQIYNVELDPNCQLIALGEVGKAFEEAYKKALSVETPTQQDIDDLRQAIYDFENTRNIDLCISDAGFATLMLPYDAALPEGVKAYSASQAGETLANGCRVLTLEKADVLQANTPYIIEGVPGTYTFSGAVTNT